MNTTLKRVARKVTAGFEGNWGRMQDKIVGATRRKVAAVGAAASSGQSLHALADKARVHQDWNADVYYRRLICEKSPENPGAWVQLGHAFKEAGFHSRAESAYNQALALKPLDAEIMLQLGHLAKVRGLMSKARAFFLEARRLEHPEKEGIDAELAILQKADNSVVFWEAPKDGVRSGIRVYLSVPLGRVAENDKSAVSANLGAADYSYAFAMRGFLQALEALEIDHTVIQNPEYISDINARSTAEINIHLGFYPPENMRFLKGAYNINCCAWEFDRLRTAEEQTSYHAFADPVTMLNLADEIWTPARSATEAMVNAGVTKPVHTVSAPIMENLGVKPKKARMTWAELDTMASHLAGTTWQPLAVAPRIQPAMSDASAGRRSSLRAIIRASDSTEPPPIFLSIFNIHDMRKNIRPMLDGFLAFSREHPDALLLLKTSTPHRGVEPLCRLLYEEQLHLANELFPPLVSERVWLTDQVLTRDGMNHLFDASSFYLCTSYGEGQNLPLLEAMGRGVVPISVDHTAMADYIRPDNAVVIPSEPGVFDRRLTSRYGMYGAMTHYCKGADVEAAISAAIALDAEQYSARSEAALETVRQQYGAPSLGAAMQDVIARITAQRLEG